mmetsp:Transcript_29485/g.83166  ORF Transcript_29485/g.83166 Transcript_29485/m.83166 type:complete len:207 (+) Transcript_29485:66-686(+)
MNYHLKQPKGGREDLSQAAGTPRHLKYCFTSGWLSGLAALSAAVTLSLCLSAAESSCDTFSCLAACILVRSPSMPVLAASISLACPSAAIFFECSASSCFTLAWAAESSRCNFAKSDPVLCCSFSSASKEDLVRFMFFSSWESSVLLRLTSAWSACSACRSVAASYTLFPNTATSAPTPPAASDFQTYDIVWRNRYPPPALPRLLS